VNDWRSDMPAKGHWLFYLVVKIAIVAFALWIAARHFGYL
jgi:hypothetical protein